MAQSTDPPKSARSVDLPVLLAVWFSLMLYSFVAAPVPSVNEPHYLCKGKHFWQPDWCANDFFLQSTNAHTVFFATVGSLTQWFSFEQVAWIGRGAALTILGLGWCSLISLISRDRWFPLYIAWTLLALQGCGNFSGEWLVGGVEGKVFSYGLLLAALGQFERHRPVLAAVWAGLAISFHPVIGLWGLLAFVGALVTQWIVCRVGKANPATQEVARRISAGRALLSAVVVAACSLPGLIPVVYLLAEPATAATRAAANYIQVYYRLAHHLDPMTFQRRAYFGYAILIVVWMLAIWLRRRKAREPGSDKSQGLCLLNGITAFAVCFAVAGLLIGWGPRPAQQMAWYAQRAQLLKFYPFRLADVLIPMAVAINLGVWLSTLNHLSIASMGRRLLIASCGLLYSIGLLIAHSHVEVNRYSGELRQDWIGICQWIDQNLPTDALIHTPHNGWAFKWFAHRAEYVAFKDCPQDAVGIVEWNRRLNYLKRWFETNYADNFYSAEELRELRAKTKITHILTDRLGPMELHPIHRNATFQVYDLTALDRPQ